MLGTSSIEVLNTGSPSISQVEIASALKRSADGMRAVALDPQNGSLNYASLAKSEAYAAFRELTRALPVFELDRLGGEAAQTAFWINLYNALILDAVVHYGIAGSLRDHLWLFRRAAYNVAGMRFSADDIEHGVLRGNRPHWVTKLPAFSRYDPRLRHALRDPDPRIHFALVCGARSCPPIAFYDGEHLDRQLDLAAASFINGGGASFDSQGSTLWISRIFRWYQRDFGGRRGVLEVVRRHLKHPDAREALDSGAYRVRFLSYDWSLNGTAQQTG
ncbi:MAG: DUF547 domain-containing protein [Anaerolineales bacterium]|jgi:hypothetical protein